MIRREVSKLALLGLSLASVTVHAVPEISNEAGWSGHVNIGVSTGSSESNMLAAIASVDLGDDTISGLDKSPDDEDVTLPGLSFEVAYTFADMGTQLYLGNQVADHLSFDLDTTLQTHFGARQHIPGVGTVDLSLAKSAMATDVWKDPYLTDRARGDTERTSTGIHVAWDRILDSNLEVSFSTREIEIDDERSGKDSDLGLTDVEQRLLRRTGELRRVDVSYAFQINEHHRLEPGIGYIDADLDGGAMAEDGAVVELRYLYEMNNWRVVTKVFYEDLESEEVNPIYGKERKVETTGGSIAVFYAEPFGLQNWTANAGISYYEGDSTIDFYDSSFGAVSIGMLYRFD